MSRTTYYAVQVTAAPVGNGPMGIAAAALTLSERPLNDAWTFLIAAAVDDAKEALRVSRVSIASAELLTNSKRLSWLLDGKEERKREKQPVSASEVPSQAHKKEDLLSRIKLLDAKVVSHFVNG